MSTTEVQQELSISRELEIPTEFASYDDTPDATIIVRLETWKRRAYETLLALREHLRTRESISIQSQAEIVSYVASFESDAPWVLEESRGVVQEILSSNIDTTSEVLETVLREHVRPSFQSNPHPQLNVETGRKLPRPAGGPLGHLDYLEGQQWKSRPSLSYILSWCMLHSDSQFVERLWHLYIPPIMTLLDDHQAKYKLQGVRLVSQLLEVAHPALLKRTGIDTLLLSSLKTCLTFLHNPETPDLIRTAVSTGIRLIELTSIEGSSARFEQLCSLLGDSIIGNIWIYANRDADTIHASIDAIPQLVRALDIGTTRYLKALIPQLVYALIPALNNSTSYGHKVSSLHALDTVISACALRIPRWGGTILDAILRCWVDLADKNAPEAECAELRHALQSTCALLLATCKGSPQELKMEWDRILALDTKLFGPLLQLAPINC